MFLGLQLLPVSLLFVIFRFCSGRNLPSSVVVGERWINDKIYGHSLYTKYFFDANIIALVTGWILCTFLFLIDSHSWTTLNRKCVYFSNVLIFGRGADDQGHQHYSTTRKQQVGQSQLTLSRLLPVKHMLPHTNDPRHVGLFFSQVTGQGQETHTCLVK